MEEGVSCLVLCSKGSVNHLDIVTDGDSCDGCIVIIVVFGVFHEVFDEGVFACVGFTDDDDTDLVRY
jgi:hypothetical protein